MVKEKNGSARRSLVAVINSREIYAVTENGETYVPVKPICEAIGVAYEPQYSKLKEDEVLSSTITLRVIVATDSKDREMVCLPLKYVYGWLFTINPKNVAETARESVIRYRTECYEVLYEHYQRKARRAAEQAEEEATLIRQKLEHLEGLKEHKAELRKIDARLDQMQADRLNPQPSLF